MLEARAPRSWASRVFTAVGLATLSVVLLWGLRTLANVLLLFFAAIVLALILRYVAEWLTKHLPISTSVALTITVLGMIGANVLIWVYALPHVSEQLSQAPEHFSQARAEVSRLFSTHPALDAVRSWVQRLPTTPSKGELASKTLGVFSSMLGALGGFAFVLIAGLYLAASPGAYVEGVLQLVPLDKRQRVRTVMQHSAHTLQRWVMGRIVSMSIVAIGTAVGLFIVGTPLALTLGLLSGALSFIPNLGPLLAVVPAVIVALPGGYTQVFWVLFVYGLVQAVESFAITPQIQKHAVSLPPAMILLAQTAMGLLTGALGVLLATPLMACLTVLIKDLYVHDVLERRAAS